jgi:hypothetical protein
MISPAYNKEKLCQEMSFDEFNLIVTAIKLTEDGRWKRLIKFTHVIRDKETGKMIDKVRTQLFLDDLIALNKMETRLRYDKALLDKSLDMMEDFTADMLKRDTAFYNTLKAKDN